MWSIRTANPNRLFIRGIISFLIGLAVIIYPDLTLVNVIRVLGGFMVIDGLLALIINYISKKRKSSAFLIVPRGTSNLIFGIVLLAFPTLMVNMFVFLIGIILLFAGITQFGSQIGGRSILGTSWIMLLISILAIVAGIVFLTKPFESAETMLTVFGVVIGLYGIGEAIWSFKIRRFQKNQPKAEPTVIDAEYEEVKD